MVPLKRGCRGVRGVWAVWGSVVGKGKAPHMGPYLPVKIVYGVWYRGWGGDAVFIELL